MMALMTGTAMRPRIRQQPAACTVTAVLTPVVVALVVAAVVVVVVAAVSGNAPLVTDMTNLI